MPDKSISRRGWWVFTAAVVLWLLAMTLRPDPTPNQINLVPLAEHSRALTCLLHPGCLVRWRAFWFLLVDVAGNVAVFVPLGLGLAGSLPPGRWTVGWAALAGGLLSLAIELAQLAIPSRATDVDDLIFNTIGAALGALVFVIYQNRGEKRRPGAVHPT